ncbi:hypothetical protein [Mangrovihabitans endophyticus]|uniref:Uncharacterized protein n=1 Tax=Mangrovihabitans endophyticus TaxID=1751298 RepID=A0A8J3FR69_9ACTN|nr:hypothetical protein [Mangrovihabitans endophyticus]GGL07050.1 hypothetical protein GCM10012284_46580 [Mangrovihabitans endophyticus]
MSADAFATAVDRLINQVGHWEQGRWSAAARPSGATGGAPAGSPPRRSDVVHALVQRLADLGAEAERRERRPVPRLGDLLLPDQIRVMADDLVAAGAPEDTLARATDEIAAARQALS